MVEVDPVKVVSHEEVVSMGAAKSEMIKSLVERIVTLIGRTP